MREQDQQDQGASFGPGSREPSPSVSAASGFDPSRIAAAAKAEQNAWDEVRKLEQGCEDEVKIEARKVRERWAERLDSARSAAAALRKAHTDLRDAAPGHAWDGRRVYRMKALPVRWMTDPRKYERIEGVVETMRSDTKLPANTSHYDRPKLGQPIVRLCKKDGTPGAKFEKLLTFAGSTVWKLSDSDGSGEAGETALAGSTEGDSAGRNGIAQP